MTIDPAVPAWIIGADEVGSFTPGSVLWHALLILLLVFLNGFFVASEFALVKVRGSQLDAMEEESNKNVTLTRHVIANLDAYLSATQLGITLASLGLGWIGEPYVAHILQPLLHLAGINHGAVLHGISFTVGFATITYLHIVLGEVTPKSLAIRKALPLSLWIAAPLHLFYVVFRPAILFLQGSAEWILRVIFRISPVAGTELGHSEEELRVILTESDGGSEVTPLSKELLINALDFRRRVVRDIMTPRGDVVYLDIQDSFEANLEVALKSGHTRFPLVQGHLDNTIGLIHIKDLMREMKKPKPDLLAVKRELTPVPEFMPLEKLLKLFLAKRAHFAVVVDEYGGAVGVVTLDNVLEELVGEIKDEFDQEQAKDFVRLNDEEFIVQGQVNLYELREVTDLELEAVDVSTIGGYVVQLLGHLPKQGEQVRIGDYLVTITQTDGRRVLQLHFKRQKTADQVSASAGHAADRDQH
ncbi:MAG: HlyC/CorC family transporter [Verrucomicrobia bacterium]|nr:HlyC/CorC family transporter [Verrucomicrobiota bacterium]